MVKLKNFIVEFKIWNSQYEFMGKFGISNFFGADSN